MKKLILLLPVLLSFLSCFSMQIVMQSLPSVARWGSNILSVIGPTSDALFAMNREISPSQERMPTNVQKFVANELKALGVKSDSMDYGVCDNYSWAVGNGCIFAGRKNVEALHQCLDSNGKPKDEKDQAVLEARMNIMHES